MTENIRNRGERQRSRFPSFFDPTKADCGNIAATPSVKSC